MKWLITGGCGFIGRNLVKNLVEEDGHFIRIIDNLSVGTRKDLSGVCDFVETDSSSLDSTAQIKTELIVADILDADLTVKAAEGIDVIIHLAANTGVAPSVENPRLDCENNVYGTLNLLEAARINQTSRFVFASSGAPVGECEPPIHEEIPPHPVSPYGASKLSGEGYCSAYFHTFGIDTVCLRFGNVYGPLSSHKDSVVAKFIKNIMEGKPLEIYGDGTQTRDFIFTDDLIQAIRLSVQTDNIGGEIFQIATSTETTVSELAEKLIETYKKIQKDQNIQIIHSSRRKGDVKRNFSDTSKASRILNWQAEISLADGLRKTIKWFGEFEKD
ncbi:MAG: GDP-mannose 4,6-dehydratase [Deltaproteobacteria bacterium]|nr:GDP-mannose 4,6-dehydratase [Deltaproteobacteria bacterium]